MTLGCGTSLSTGQISANVSQAIQRAAAINARTSNAERGAGLMYVDVWPAEGVDTGSAELAIFEATGEDASHEIDACAKNSA